ncbi:MAG TPA: sigma-70 family RNA polymerase sigma factor [Thermoanaerobaculia bacterium]|nr:sigma-70 family RNA polymerase sigma factor [Thermoanaerobaculia bacterium]
MARAPQQEVTELLLAWGRGDETALARLTPLVHDELRRIARRYMAGERADHTLQTSALVNEAYLRLLDLPRVDVKNRAHFFGLAAQLMRRVLVDYARARRSKKRGAGIAVLSLDDVAPVAASRSPDLIALDDALEGLAAQDARKARVVEMRFFGGMSVDETAEALRVSPDTVHRDWRLAKAWLLHEMKRTGVDA